jgi:hypothetical protein
VPNRFEPGLPVEIANRHTLGNIKEDGGRRGKLPNRFGNNRRAKKQKGKEEKKEGTEQQKEQSASSGKPNIPANQKKRDGSNAPPNEECRSGTRKNGV